MLETISVTTGTLEPWLGIWAEIRTETADRHLRDTVDWWLIEGGIAGLHFGCEDPTDRRGVAVYRPLRVPRRNWGGPTHR